MTKDIIKLSATLLGLDEIVNYLDKKTSTLTSQMQSNLQDLTTFTSYILREITKEYIPLSHTEEIASDSQCQISFSKLSKKILAVKDIKDSFGNSATFNLYPDYIKVGFPNKTYTITYNYTLGPISSVEQSLTLPLGLDYFTVSYGVASEYALSRLLYSEADMWESKFKNSLESVRSRVGERRFYSRRLK